MNFNLRGVLGAPLKLKFIVTTRSTKFPIKKGLAAPKVVSITVIHRPKLIIRGSQCQCGLFRVRGNEQAHHHAFSNQPTRLDRVDPTNPSQIHR